MNKLIVLKLIRSKLFAFNRTFDLTIIFCFISVLSDTDSAYRTRSLPAWGKGNKQRPVSTTDDLEELYAKVNLHLNKTSITSQILNKTICSSFSYRWTSAKNARIACETTRRPLSLCVDRDRRIYREWRWNAKELSSTMSERLCKTHNSTLWKYPLLIWWINRVL